MAVTISPIYRDDAINQIYKAFDSYRHGETYGIFAFIQECLRKYGTPVHYPFRELCESLLFTEQQKIQGIERIFIDSKINSRDDLQKVFPGAVSEIDTTKIDVKKKSSKQAVFEIMRKEPWVYIVTHDDEGFWTRQDDACDSYYRKEMKEILEKQIKELLEACQSFTETAVRSVIGMLRIEKSIRVDSFRPDPRLIHFKNGIYIIPKREFHPRNKPFPYAGYQLKTFTMIPWDYDPKSVKPVSAWEFEFHLCYQFGDWNQVEKFYEWLGYCFTNHVLFKKCCLLIGASNAGKSTVNRILRYYLGTENCSIVHLYDLCMNKESTYALMDKLANFDDDVGDSIALRGLSTLKTLTGDDLMQIRGLYANYNSYHNITKHTFGANQLPYMPDIDLITAGRFIMFQFHHGIDKDDLDPSFEGRMKTPIMARYVISHAMAAYERLEKRGFFEGMLDKDMLYFMQKNMDSLFRFVEEACDKGLDIGSSAKQADLYEGYSDWLATNHVKNTIQSQKHFTQRLASFGYLVAETHRDGTHIKVYKGLNIKGAVIHIKDPTKTTIITDTLEAHITGTPLPVPRKRKQVMVSTNLPPVPIAVVPPVPTPPVPSVIETDITGTYDISLETGIMMILPENGEAMSYNDINVNLANIGLKPSIAETKAACARMQVSKEVMIDQGYVMRK